MFLSRHCRHCSLCCSIFFPPVSNISKRFVYKTANANPLKVKLLEDQEKIRNIGIIAHIDGGKTTTTERMLYYSGFSHLMGEVHDGDTVMDYMEQERERGITITLAAITFNWLKHQINLIDTPGHVDFTVEVERSLRVLDGAVTILDASAGVEAQTVTVWKQADRYTVPRIVYLNKMDKKKASVELCIHGLQKKLNALPLCLHIPFYSNEVFKGVVDLLSMDIIIWNNTESQNDGSVFTRKPLKTFNLDLHSLALKKREELIHKIADLDNEIAEAVIESDNLTEIPTNILNSALRRITLQGIGVPVLCGSSYRNTGVQLLLDAVVSYLPSPQERQHHFLQFYKNQLCAMAFKIVHDKIKGPVTFIRLYSGTLKEGQTIYNANQDNTEKINKIMLAFADEFKDVPSATEGQIVLISGLKNVVTGDTLTSSKASAQNAKTLKNKVTKGSKEDFSAVLASIVVPDPVFFCSIEAPSLSTQVALDKALVCLQKEDPSLKVSVNPDSGQTIIAGMGELHIEVIKGRILKEYGVESYLGPLQVSYRETIRQSSKISHLLDKTLGGKQHYVNITLGCDLVKGLGVFRYEHLNVICTNENQLSKIREDHLKSIRNGISLALMHGPLLACPVVDVHLKLLEFTSTHQTSPAMISAASSQCVNALLRSSDMVLLEPVMRLEIVCDEKYKIRVLEDLESRRSDILDVDLRDDVSVVLAKTPLSELRSYSTILRTFTSGTASFTIEFDSYITMNKLQQDRTIEDVTGFAPI